MGNCCYTYELEVQSKDQNFAKKENVNVVGKETKEVKHVKEHVIQQDKDSDHQIGQQMKSEDQTIIQEEKQAENDLIQIQQSIQGKNSEIQKSVKKISENISSCKKIAHQIEQQHLKLQQKDLTVIKEVQKDKNVSINVEQPNQEGEFVILKQIKEKESGEEDNIKVNHQIEEQKLDKGQQLIKEDKQHQNISIEVQQPNNQGVVISQMQIDKKQSDEQEDKLEKDLVQIPENQQRIMDPREMYMFQNQSIRFGTHRRLKYHEKQMGKGAGCGRESEDFFIRKITITRQNKVLFEINFIDNYSKKCQYAQIEVTEHQYKQLDALMDQIYSIMCFQIAIQKYKGVADGAWNMVKDFKKKTYKMFKQAFEFWASDDKNIYSLFVVEERLTLLKQYLSSFQKLDKPKCEYLCRRLWYDTEDILYGDYQSDIRYFYNFKFDQIFLRYMKHKINEVSIENPAYSFRNEHLISKDLITQTDLEIIKDYKSNLNQRLNKKEISFSEVQTCLENLKQNPEKVIKKQSKLNQQAFSKLNTFQKRQEHKTKTVRPYIFSPLHNYAKNQKLGVLVEVIENGKGYDFIDGHYYDYNKYINKEIGISIEQKLINNLEKYELQKILGEGSYGKVFEASINEESIHSSLALKQIENQTLKQLSSIIIESQFHLFFTNEHIPLLKLEDLFLQKSETGFMLNLAMIQGTCELSDLLKEKNKGLGFIDLYPIFKDILLGITYMNSHFLTHGDIKPDNILIIDNKFCLCDYGTGINLYYEQTELNNDFFQVGYWDCAGTPIYCDPIIKREMEKLKTHFNYRLQKVYLDLFKNDIYQAGITMFQIATGKNITDLKSISFGKAKMVSMNSHEYDQQKCYTQIHKLNLPTLLKNLIIHMIQFDPDKRINSYALYQAFLFMSESIVNSTQLSILRSLDVDKQYFYENVLKFDHKKHNWFVIIQEDGDFKANDQYRKIKNQTQKDQSFFSDSQKPDYNSQNNRCQQIQKHEILLLIPNYILCVYDQLLSNEESRIILNNQSITVKNTELQKIQFQYYRKNSHVEFYDQDTNSWLPCKINTVRQDSNILTSSEIANKAWKVNFQKFNQFSQILNNKIMKGEIQFSQFGMEFEKLKKKLEYENKQLDKSNKKVQLIKTIYNISVKDCLVSNLPMNTLKLRESTCLGRILCKQENLKFGYQKVDTEEKHILRFDGAIYSPRQLFNVYDADLYDNEQPLRVYSNRCEDLKKNSYLKGISTIYQYDGKEEKLKKLLRFGLVQMLKAVEVTIEDAHLKVFQSGALKMLYLCQCKISADQLVSLFKIFSTIKLQRFYLQNYGYYAINFDFPTQAFLDELKNSFAKFANSQYELYYLDFELTIKGNSQVKKYPVLLTSLAIAIQKEASHLRLDVILLFSLLCFKVYADGHEDEVKEVAKTIRSCLHEYYNDWQCDSNSWSFKISNK